MTSARLRAPQVRIDLATTADIAGIVAVRVNAAEDLTERFGGGHWSGHATERGVALDVRQGKVLVARRSSKVLATFQRYHRQPVRCE